MAFSEDLYPEDEHLDGARRHAAEVRTDAVAPAAGATLGFLAAAIGARAIAEIGTGTGVSGLWLLRSTAPDCVLTSVDLEAENQRLAKEAFVAAGIAPQRFRLITGSALDVLPRLIDEGYDLIVIDGDETEFVEYLTEAMRLARPGGLIVFHHAFGRGKVADPAQRDPRTTSVREVVTQALADESLATVVLPVGDGLLALRKPV